MTARGETLDFRVASFGLRRGSATLFEDLSLRVRPGAAVGVVGRNGGGKSLLLSAWMGWAPPTVTGTGYVALGSRLLHDSLGPCREQLDAVVGRSLALVLPEPGLHLNPAIGAAEQLRRACQLQPRGLSPERRLEIVGLSASLLDRYPSYLSSGQRQRLAVACSLLGRGVLICDDPAAALDPVLRARFFEELAREKDHGDLAVLILGARKEDLPKFVDEIVELQPTAPSSRPTSAKSPAARHEKRRPALSRTPALSVRKLGVRREGRVVLTEVELDVDAGEIVLLVGESGAGKSTLLEAIARTVAVEPGSEIHVLGRDLAQLKPEVGRPDPPELAALRKRLRIAFQDPDTLFDPELPTAAVLQRFDESSRMDTELCRRLRAHLEAQRSVRIGQLSGWDKRALSLWAALDRTTEILLADEPLAGADPEHLQWILDGFVELAERGVAMLIVTHLIPPAAPVADRVAIVYRGRIAEVLAGSDLLVGASHPYTCQLVAAALESSSEKPELRPLAVPTAPAPQELFAAPPFDPVVGGLIALGDDAEPQVCAMDAIGRVWVLDGEEWRRVEGEVAEQLAVVLATRGLDTESLLAVGGPGSDR